MVDSTSLSPAVQEQERVRTPNPRPLCSLPKSPILTSQPETNICPLVIALWTAIKELEDEMENPDSILNRTGAVKKNELGIMVKNCSEVLQQLNTLLVKYKSLGTTSKRTWNRLRWGPENLQDIREITNVAYL